jgi:tRNA(Ile)-lysidine synthase
VRTPSPPALTLDTSLLKPGLRLAVGLSGGADSVALLCALNDRAGELGLVLHAAHLHHGLRGAEADADLAFARDLASRLSLPFHEARVDTAAEARATPLSANSKNQPDKPNESIETAARRLRYRWFRDLMAAGKVDAVATAHTKDDQAETVLAKFLRGAWTEGLSGIHPVLEFPEGRIVRPLLSTTRAEVEAFLHACNQNWREDSTNRHLTFTRNRIRHELLPDLEKWNPQLREHLAQMADLAREEDSWWRAELPRLAYQLILPGRPVRGGGRAAAEGLALDLAKLVLHPIALQRRILRYAAGQLGSAPDFAATEAMRSLALTGHAGQKLELAQGLRVERTHRELRLTRGPITASNQNKETLQSQYECVIPGEVTAPAFGLHLQVNFDPDLSPGASQSAVPLKAVLRPWKPGDRVRLRHSGSLRKVKEVLERMKVTGSERTLWPVLEFDNTIIWMRGVELESPLGIHVHAVPLEPSANSSRK